MSVTELLETARKSIATNDRTIMEYYFDSKPHLLDLFSSTDLSPQGQNQLITSCLLCPFSVSNDRVVGIKGKNRCDILNLLCINKMGGTGHALFVSLSLPSVEICSSLTWLIPYVSEKSMKWLVARALSERRLDLARLLVSRGAKVHIAKIMESVEHDMRPLSDYPIHYRGEDWSKVTFATDLQISNFVAELLDREERSYNVTVAY